MPQLHLSDQQFYCLLRCDLYQRFKGPYIWCYFFSPEYLRHRACLTWPSLREEADRTCNQTFQRRIDRISSHAKDDDRVNLICQYVTPDHKTSQSLEATRSVRGSNRSLWNSTCVSAVVLLRRLSNFSTIRWFNLPIPRLRDFTRTYDRTFHWLLKWTSVAAFTNMV